MRIGGKTWHRDLPWIVAMVLLAVVASGFYLAEYLAAGRLPGGSSRTGFVCGVIAGLIVVFELLLWPRRRVRSWRLGSAQALMHARLLFIGGWLNWALMALFLAVIFSGIWGLAVQQWIPGWMLEQVPAETIYEQIDHVAAQHCREAERLVRGMCVADPAEHGTEHGGDETSADPDDHAVITGLRSMTGIQGKVLQVVQIHAIIPGTAAVRRMFFDEVKPYLLGGRWSGSSLASRTTSVRLFAAIRGSAPTEAEVVIDHLERACDIRRQFDLQARLHGWLHGWLLVHVPLSVALGVLLAMHVPVALWYW